MGEALRRAAVQHSTSRVDLTEGVHIGVGITSLTYTFTPVHYEDMLLGAVNDLLVGAHKVWAFVPPANADLFLQLLEKKDRSSFQRVFCKSLRPMLTVAEVRVCCITRLSYTHQITTMLSCRCKRWVLSSSSNHPGILCFHSPGVFFTGLHHLDSAWLRLQTFTPASLTSTCHRYKCL